MAGIKTKMSPIKKRQYVILTLGLCALLALSVAASVFFSKPKPAPVQQTSDISRRNFGERSGAVDPNQIWQLEESARMRSMQQDLERLKREQDRTRGGTPQTQAPSDARIIELENKVKQMEDLMIGPPGDGLPPHGDLTGHPPFPGMMTPQGEPIRGIMRVDMGSSGASTPVSPSARAGQAPTQDGAKVREGEIYIPPGTFARGFLLSGLDAPTAGQAQQNPLPVVISAVDMLNMPNQFKADYRDCRFLASGAGDLSSERAVLRLERMACIRHDGGAIDIPVFGMVMDQTGKPGIRGRLVSKQGQVLARALLAGVASGIGQGFSTMDYSVSQSAFGTVATNANDDNQARFRQGIGIGVGNALNKLADYYLDLADKMHPVIEIDAGTPVDIVFTRGFAVNPLN